MPICIAQCHTSLALWPLIIAMTWRNHKRRKRRSFLSSANTMAASFCKETMLYCIADRQGSHSYLLVWSVVTGRVKWLSVLVVERMYMFPSWKSGCWVLMSLNLQDLSLGLAGYVADTFHSPNSSVCSNHPSVTLSWLRKPQPSYHIIILPFPQCHLTGVRVCIFP